MSPAVWARVGTEDWGQSWSDPDCMSAFGRGSDPCCRSYGHLIFGAWRST